jgi:hypothetical protein
MLARAYTNSARSIRPGGSGFSLEPIVPQRRLCRKALSTLGRSTAVTKRRREAKQPLAVNIMTHFETLEEIAERLKPSTAGHL